jgi:hypothetical protein
MQPKAAKLINYARTPTWISVNYAAQFTKDGGNFQYSEEEKAEFRNHPETHLKTRHEIEARSVFLSSTQTCLIEF